MNRILTRTGAPLLWRGLPLMAALLISTSARAETFVVMAEEDESDADPGDGACASAADRCTLRAAIEEANADDDFDAIYVSPGHYLLSQGTLVIGGQVEISGRDAAKTRIDANQQWRILELEAQADNFVYVRLTGLTLENGYAGAPGSLGGAVMIPEKESLFVLDRCIVRNNFAASGGGGIYNAGNLEVSRTAIVDNISDPEAVGDWYAAGGGIYNAGSALITRSSITGNSALRGGGLANESGIVNITNTTISDNSAKERGGGISNMPGWDGGRAFAELAFSTIVDNRAGSEPDDPWEPAEAGGVYNAGSLQIASSILARNRDHQPTHSGTFAPDCVSEVLSGQFSDDVSLVSQGGLIVGAISERCPYVASGSDQLGSGDFPLDPGLPSSSSAIADEVTSGYEPYEESPAIDKAGEDFCSYEDQWGLSRPVPGSDGADARCDAGAIERNGRSRRRSVMMVVGDRVFSPSDLILSVKLSANGFDIRDETPAELSGEEREVNIVLISESVSSAELPSSLASLEKPILCLEPAALDLLQMTEEGWDRTQGAATNQTTLRIANDGRVDSSYIGELEVADSGATFGWGVPATSDAFKQAELIDRPGRWAIFGYDEGALLADGSRAAGPRVSFFAASGTPERLNQSGWNLFGGLLAQLAPPP